MSSDSIMRGEPDTRPLTGQDARHEHPDPATRGYPRRIVCLTEETTETLYLLEEDWRIVGISGFTVRPPRARREKPKVSAFTSAKVDRICELQPDLVLGFSDLQADIAAELVRRGLDVHVFNQRDIAGIFAMIRVLGGMIGCEAKAAALATRLEENLARIRASAARFERRPRVYFEEWDEPMISCIRWVSELIGVAGGEDCFADQAQQRSRRTASSPIRTKSCVARRTSFSAPGAARSSARSRRGAPGMGKRARGRATPAARDQVVDHPAARARSAHRRRRSDARDLRRLATKGSARAELPRGGHDSASVK